MTRQQAGVSAEQVRELAIKALNVPGWNHHWISEHYADTLDHVTEVIQELLALATAPPEQAQDANENLADYLLRTPPPDWNYKEVLQLASKVAQADQPQAVSAGALSAEPLPPWPCLNCGGDGGHKENCLGDLHIRENIERRILAALAAHDQNSGAASNDDSNPKELAVGRPAPGQEVWVRAKYVDTAASNLYVSVMMSERTRHFEPKDVIFNLPQIQAEALLAAHDQKVRLEKPSTHDEVQDASAGDK